MNKWIYSLGMVLAAAIIATGCGGGGKENNSATKPAESQGAASTAITINAKNFEFDQKDIKVKKGDTVSITLKNSQGNHAVTIEGYDKVIKVNQTVTFTADKAGEFKFACSLICGKGHADMVGKLVVE
jgi:cytochrome c oxidase subunit 2